MKTQLILVRHGETEWNRLKKYQGQANSPLTELGIRQAEAVRDALADEPIDTIVSSDLGRALQTAQIIAEPHDLRVIPEARLRERHLGVFQGLDKDSISERYPEEVRRYRSGDPDHVIPDGESARQRYERSTACLRELAKSHAGDTLVVVAHGGILRGAIEMVLDLPMNRKRRFSLYNASIARFSIFDGYWMMDSWGETWHLKDIGKFDDV